MSTPDVTPLPSRTSQPEIPVTPTETSPVNATASVATPILGPDVPQAGLPENIQDHHDVTPTSSSDAVHDLADELAAEAEEAPAAPPPPPAAPAPAAAPAAPAAPAAAAPAAPTGPSAADRLKETAPNRIQELNAKAKKHQMQVAQLKTTKTWGKVMVGGGAFTSLVLAGLAVCFCPPLGVAIAGPALFFGGQAAAGGGVALMKKRPDLTNSQVELINKRALALDRSLELFKMFPKNAANPDGTSFEEFLEANAGKQRTELTKKEKKLDPHAIKEDYLVHDVEKCVTIFNSRKVAIPELQTKIQELTEQREELEAAPGNHDEEIARINNDIETTQNAIDQLEIICHDLEVSLPSAKISEAEKRNAHNLLHGGWMARPLDPSPKAAVNMNDDKESICFFGREAKVPSNLQTEAAERGQSAKFDFLSNGYTGNRKLVIDGKSYRSVTHYLLAKKFEKIEKANRGAGAKRYGDPGYYPRNKQLMIKFGLEHKTSGKDAMEYFCKYLNKEDTNNMFEGMEEDLKKALFHKFINPDGSISEEGHALLATGDTNLVAGYELGMDQYGAKYDPTTGTLTGENLLGRHLMDFRTFLKGYETNPQDTLANAEAKTIEYAQSEINKIGGKIDDLYDKAKDKPVNPFKDLNHEANRMAATPAEEREGSEFKKQNKKYLESIHFFKKSLQPLRIALDEMEKEMQKANAQFNGAKAIADSHRPLTEEDNAKFEAVEAEYKKLEEKVNEAQEEIIKYETGLKEAIDKVKKAWA